MVIINCCDVGSLYLVNVAILKRFNDNYYKLSVCRSLRVKGVEVERERAKRGINSSKLENNISRAKSKVKEYALCNDFKYFVTLTIDKEKYNRYDLKKYYKDLGKFLNNYGTNHNTKVQYLLIPEEHEDGAWHMHGLITGILDKHLIENDNAYMEWVQYAKKFGYMSLGIIKDQDKVSSYITKYITKNLSKSINELNAHMYYCSKGLKVAEEIKRGTLSANNIPYDFENDYVKIKVFDNDSIKNSIGDYNIKIDE